jgi:hypothetical protein
MGTEGTTPLLIQVIPMFSVILFSLPYALIPAIVVEGVVLWILLRTRILTAFLVSTAGNIASTLASVPLTFVLWGLLLQPLGLSAIVVRDRARTQQLLDVASPLAILALCVPFWLTSSFIELIVASSWDQVRMSPRHPIRSVFIANAMTYLLIAGWATWKLWQARPWELPGWRWIWES